VIVRNTCCARSNNEYNKRNVKIKQDKINATMRWVGHALGGDERQRAEGMG
jgi:hypothetical protein